MLFLDLVVYIFIFFFISSKKEGWLRLKSFVKIDDILHGMSRVFEFIEFLTIACSTFFYVPYAYLSSIWHYFVGRAPPPFSLPTVLILTLTKSFSFHHIWQLILAKVESKSSFDFGRLPKARCLAS